MLLLLGLLTEILSSIEIGESSSNAVHFNVFLLAEALLLLVQFKSWGVFGKRKHWYLFSGLLLVVVWLMENHSFTRLSKVGSGFVIVSSILIVVMSIFTINRLVINYTGPLLRSAAFVFCCAFCFYFSSMLLLEMFFVYGSGLSIQLQAAAFKAGCVVNAICNFLYLIAVLWIPQKPRFIMC